MCTYIIYFNFNFNFSWWHYIYAWYLRGKMERRPKRRQWFCVFHTFHFGWNYIRVSSYNNWVVKHKLREQGFSLFFFAKNFTIFDDFSTWSTLKVLWNFEKSSNMPEIWQQLALPILQFIPCTLKSNFGYPAVSCRNGFKVSWTRLFFIFWWNAPKLLWNFEKSSNMAKK